MYSMGKGLTILSAVAFLLAVASNYVGPILSVTAEGFSRTCSNLALLAIASVVVFGNGRLVGRSAPLP
jgi:hypothetical protein